MDWLELQYLLCFLCKFNHFSVAASFLFHSLIKTIKISLFSPDPDPTLQFIVEIAASTGDNGPASTTSPAKD